VTTPPRATEVDPPRLWAITPPVGIPDASAVDAWSPDRGDVGLWIRTPGAAPGAVVERCAAVLERARTRGIPVVLGAAATDLEAAAVEVARLRLAGVVLRGDPDLSALRRARTRLGAFAWIGRSIHGATAEHDACTFSVLAPIFTPYTAKPVATVALGLEVLAQVAQAPGARILALGGVDADNAAACLAAGAWGLAGIRSFFGDARRIAEDVAALRGALPTAKHGPTSP
jgi:thiamine monophosphate synthase